MNHLVAPPRRTVGVCFYVSSFCVLLGAIGCGGSASETPPPLEPDPHALPRTYENPAKSENKPLTDDITERPAASAVPPTWGSGRKKAPVIPLGDGG